MNAKELTNIRRHYCHNLHISKYRNCSECDDYKTCLIGEINITDEQKKIRDEIKY